MSLVLLPKCSFKFLSIQKISGTAGRKDKRGLIKLERRGGVRTNINIEDKRRILVFLKEKP